MAVMRKKLKGATLVETQVAMTIITLAAGFAVSIFLMLSRPFLSTGSLTEAQQRSAEIMDTSTFILENGFYGREINIGHLNYRVSSFDYALNLREITIEVVDIENKMLYSRKRLFYLEEK